MMGFDHAGGSHSLELISFDCPDHRVSTEARVLSCMKALQSLKIVVVLLRDNEAAQTDWSFFADIGRGTCGVIWYAIRIWRH